MEGIPLNDYPRPQLVRNGYMSLNGTWNCCITRNSCKLNDENKAVVDMLYEGDILVPFPPESLQSGVQHILMPNEAITYNRTFEIEPGFLKEKTLLHFDAVDYECEVYINGNMVISHVGGYIPFHADVSSYIVQGTNKLDVIVTDPTDTNEQARGKQKLKRGGIFYTPVSGIWQSVWLETVPKNYIKSIKIDTDIDKKTVTIQADTDASEFFATVLENRKIVSQGLSDNNKCITFKLDNLRYWSCHDPFLYNLELKAGDDVVQSYFGMRKFSIVKDKTGHARLALNNDVFYHNGVLDQGYYPDTIYTPKTDEEMIKDIKLVMKLGFNMIRKHIKIEPLRWYYHCDRLGVLVWQDMVNGGGQYKFSTVALNPLLGIKMNDKSYKAFSREDAFHRQEFEKEIALTVNHLYNCVSLCQWTLFNEGWGQFESNRLTEKLRAMDNTRHIDSTSGWHEQRNSQSDFYSSHIYFKKIRFKTRKRYKDKVMALTEFGGYAMEIPGHMSFEKVFGYKMFKNKEALQNAYDKLYNKYILANIRKGLSASVYTQLTDVEEELNGLVTYDREVVKFNIQRIKTINNIINKMNMDAKTKWRR